jgi:hypothetical protein
MQAVLNNRTHGDVNIGMMVPDAVRLLKDVDVLPEDTYRRAALLGWCTVLVS